MKNKPRDLLFGVAVGDALGVPYEFSSREKMKKNPAKDMVGYMVHNQLPGTWSDDSSLTFCLAESLLGNYSLLSVAENFIKWRNNAHWSARGRVFDIGITTSRAITRLENILKNKTFDDLALLKYEAEEYDNGNGSLMRISPLLFEIKGKDIFEQFDVIWKNSALTHRHIRAAMCCLIYLKLAEYLLDGNEKNEAYLKTRRDIQSFWDKMKFSEAERIHFSRVIENDISTYEEDSILSGGYVMESLEASFWCLLKTDSFEYAVLKAINLGHDTDTTGAITGGLAGLYYGFEAIPKYWIISLARMEEIEELSVKLIHKYHPL